MSKVWSHFGAGPGYGCPTWVNSGSKLGKGRVQEQQSYTGMEPIWWGKWSGACVERDRRLLNKCPFILIQLADTEHVMEHTFTIGWIILLSYTWSGTYSREEIRVWGKKLTTFMHYSSLITIFSMRIKIGNPLYTSTSVYYVYWFWFNVSLLKLKHLTGSTSLEIDWLVSLPHVLWAEQRASELTYSLVGQASLDLYSKEHKCGSIVIQWSL